MAQFGCVPPIKKGSITRASNPGQVMSKKRSIYKTAIRLFASQGYDATTTLQIAREVGVTEPAVFYHFKSKHAFFSTILEEASRVYFDRMDALNLDASPAFEILASLIRIHFSIVAEEPEHIRLLLRTCPARLADPDSTCTRIYRQARSRLKETLMEILEKGMASNEFVQVDKDATASMLMALLNGLMRQQVAAMDMLDGVESATIAFCTQALVNRASVEELDLTRRRSEREKDKKSLTQRREEREEGQIGLDLS